MQYFKSHISNLLLQIRLLLQNRNLKYTLLKKLSKKINNWQRKKQTFLYKWSMTMSIEYFSTTIERLFKLPSAKFGNDRKYCSDPMLINPLPWLIFKFKKKKLPFKHFKIPTSCLCYCKSMYLIYNTWNKFSRNSLRHNFKYGK